MWKKDFSWGLNNQLFMACTCIVWMATSWREWLGDMARGRPPPGRSWPPKVYIEEDAVVTGHAQGWPVVVGWWRCRMLGKSAERRSSRRWCEGGMRCKGLSLGRRGERICSTHGWGHATLFFIWLSIYNLSYLLNQNFKLSFVCIFMFLVTRAFKLDPFWRHFDEFLKFC